MSSAPNAFVPSLLIRCSIASQCTLAYWQDGFVAATSSARGRREKTGLWNRKLLRNMQIGLTAGHDPLFFAVRAYRLMFHGTKIVAVLPPLANGIHLSFSLSAASFFDLCLEMMVYNTRKENNCSDKGDLFTPSRLFWFA